MKVLLDEMLPAGVADLLPGIAVVTVKDAGFTGLKNGELLRRAVTAGFEVLLTADRNLPDQQNVAASGLAIILVPGSRLAEIRPRANEIQTAVLGAQVGTVQRISRLT